jgi:hypothetical protein
MKEKIKADSIDINRIKRNEPFYSNKFYNLDEDYKFSIHVNNKTNLKKS